MDSTGTTRILEFGAVTGISARFNKLNRKFKALYGMVLNLLRLANNRIYSVGTIAVKREVFSPAQYRLY